MDRQQVQSEHRDRWNWRLLLLPLLTLLLGCLGASVYGASVYPSAQPYLLAIGCLIAHRADSGRGLVVKAARAIGAALLFGLFVHISVEAWGSVTGMHEDYDNPISGMAYAMELAIIHVLWRKRMDEVGKPLFVSLSAMLAQVHFELAGGSGIELPISVALSGLALGFAIIAARRGETITGVAAVLVAGSMVWKLYLNAATAGWRYLGFWTAEWV